MRRAPNDSDELLDDFMDGKSSDLQVVQELEPQTMTPGMPTLLEVHKSVAVAVEHLLGAEVKISVSHCFCGHPCMQQEVFDRTTQPNRRNAHHLLPDHFR